MNINYISEGKQMTFNYISEEKQMDIFARTPFRNNARRHPLLLLVLAVAFGHAVPSSAQPSSSSSYPNRPIRLVVPYGAGSGADGAARSVTPKISEILGQQVVIDNRAGASGTIGATLVSKSPPDGYTLLLGSVPSNAIAPSLDKNLAYDPVRDLAAVALIVSYPYVLTVSTTLPVGSVKELIAYAKARPGVLNYGSTGNGTGVQLAGALFSIKAGVNITHIPYNIMGQLLADLSSGSTQLIFYPYQGLLSVIQSGKVRVLATTGAKRSASLPDFPTMAEQGVSDYNILAWIGFNAPAGTPTDRIQVLYNAIRKTMLDPKVAARVSGVGYDIDLLDPAEFTEFTKREVVRYRQIIQESGSAVTSSDTR